MPDNRFAVASLGGCLVHIPPESTNPAAYGLTRFLPAYQAKLVLDHIAAVLGGTEIRVERDWLIRLDVLSPGGTGYELWPREEGPFRLHYVTILSNGELVQIVAPAEAEPLIVLHDPEIDQVSIIRAGRKY